MASADTVTSAERQRLATRIAERQENQANESVLSEGVHGFLELFSQNDSQSLDNLKRLTKDASSNAQIEAALTKDHKYADWRDTFSHYTTSFAKVVPLFMGPGKGLVLSAALYGIDQVR